MEVYHKGQKFSLSAGAQKYSVLPLKSAGTGYMPITRGKPTVDLTKPGYFVKLHANTKYALAIANRIVTTFPALPSLTITDGVGTYDVVDALAGGVWYQNFTSPLQPTADCFFFCLDGEAVYEWNVIAPYTGMSETDGGYSYWVNKFGKKFTEPFSCANTNFEQRYKYREAFTLPQTTDLERKVYRQNKTLADITDSNFCVYFIGDSITFATSNAGLQRAFRKQVPYKLSCNWNSIAVSGTCVTNNCGMAWTNGEKGIAGLFGESDIFSSAVQDRLIYPSVFVVAIGTNDFGNNATLGDVESDDRSTTFAGCYMALVEKLQELYPDVGIICIPPLNRETYDTENAAGCKLIDYCRVIHEVVSVKKNVFILDLTDNYIINYANYPTAFVDGIHPNKYAHAVISNYLYDMILRVVTYCGANYVPPEGSST